MTRLQVLLKYGDSQYLIIIDHKEQSILASFFIFNYKPMFYKIVIQINMQERTNINKPACTQAHSFSQLKYICLRPECLPQCLACSLCLQQLHNGPHHHTIHFEDFKSNIIPQLSANAIYGNSDFLSDLKQSRARLLKKISEIQAQMLHLIKRIRLAIDKQFETIIKSYNQETYKSELAQLDKQVTLKKVINICYAVQIIKRNEFNNKHENIVRAENQYDKLLSEFGDTFTNMVIQSENLKYVSQLKSSNKYYRLRENINQISPKANSYMTSEQSRQQSKKGYGQGGKRQKKMKKRRQQVTISLLTEDEAQQDQSELERSRQKKKEKVSIQRLSSQSKKYKNHLIENENNWKPISNNHVICAQKQSLELRKEPQKTSKAAECMGRAEKKINTSNDQQEKEEKIGEQAKAQSKGVIQNNEEGKQKGDFKGKNMKNILIEGKNQNSHQRFQQVETVKNKAEQRKPTDNSSRTPPNLKNNKKIVEPQIDCCEKKYQNNIRPKTNPKHMTQQQIEIWFYEHYKENEVYTIVLSQRVRGNKTEYLWFHNGKFQWNDKDYLMKVDEWPRLKQYMEYIQKNWN